MAYELISRKDARAQGLRRYFNGVPCIRRHIAERLVSNLTCMECANERQNARRLTLDDGAREKIRDYGRAWDQANREKLNAISRENNKKPEVKARRASWYQENKDRIKPLMAKNYQENRAERIAYTKAWAEANPNKIKARYLENRDRDKARRRRWIEENPEKHREQTRQKNRNRRAQKKGASGTYTAAEVAVILVSQNYLCKYCVADLRVVEKHLDHVMPLSRGGSNDKSNLAWLCAKHNLQKADKDPIEYELSIGYRRCPPIP